MSSGSMKVDSERSRGLMMRRMWWLWCVVTVLVVGLRTPHLERTVRTLAAASWVSVAEAACDAGIPIAAACARLGLHCAENVGACDWGQRLNDDRAYLDAHACTDDHPCGATRTERYIFDPIKSTDDGYYLFVATEESTLESVTCRCFKNCGTPAVIQFHNNGTNIDIDTTSTLTCDTGSSTSSFSIFDTSDLDRILALGEHLEMDVTNSPTTDQAVILTLIYSTPAS
jgi:hypothetical protein